MLDGEVPPEVGEVPSITEVVELDLAEKVDIVNPEPVKEVEVTEPENPEDTLSVQEPPTPEFIPESSNDVREVLVHAEPVVARPLAQEHVEEAPVVTPVEDVIPDVVSEKLAVEVSHGVDEPTNEEPILGEVPPVGPESAAKPQETEVVNPPAPSEEAVVEPEPTVLIPDAPQEEAKQVDRPWTPSYSVSAQGGGLDNTAPADEEVVEPAVVPEPPVEEPTTPVVETETLADVRTLGALFLPGLTGFLFRSPLSPNQRPPPTTLKSPLHGRPPIPQTSRVPVLALSLKPFSRTIPSQSQL